MKWLGIILFTLMCVPPIDPYLDSVMTLQMLVQIPLLLLSGLLLSYRTPIKPPAPVAFGILVLSVGLVLFWMIPRSLDLAVEHSPIDLLMHLCLLGAGYGFGVSLPRLSWMIQIATGIYLTAMWSTFALILSQSHAQVCARFSLAQQQAAGVAMLWAGGGFLLLHLVNSLLALGRMNRPSPLTPQLKS